MEKLNLTILNVTLLSREEHKDTLVYKINTEEGVKEFNSYYYGHSDIFLTEHKDEKFYLITDGFSPLALRSLDGITKFILNPTKLMDNDVYLFNKYRITREKLISLINEEFRSKKLERRK